MRLARRLTIASTLVALAGVVLSASVRAEEGHGHRTCTIEGTQGDDRLIEGTSGPDVICGLGGQDKIKGYGGDDVIYGGRGRDLIYDHGGEDTVWGGSGGDELRAGSHDDRVHGGSGNDGISLQRGSDVAWGGPGRDGVSMREGPGVLHGGAGRDFLCAWDAQGDDLLFGGHGRDRYHAIPTTSAAPSNGISGSRPAASSPALVPEPSLPPCPCEVEHLGCDDGDGRNRAGRVCVGQASIDPQHPARRLAC